MGGSGENIEEDEVTDIPGQKIKFLPLLPTSKDLIKEEEADKFRSVNLAEKDLKGLDDHNSSYRVVRDWFMEKLEMGKNLEDIIRPHLHYLCQHTTNYRQLQIILFSHGVLGRVAFETMTNTYESCLRLYQRSMRYASLDVMLVAWEESGNKHLASHIWSKSKDSGPFNRSSSATEYEHNFLASKAMPNVHFSNPIFKRRALFRNLELIKITFIAILVLLNLTACLTIVLRGENSNSDMTSWASEDGGSTGTTHILTDRVTTNSPLTETERPIKFRLTINAPLHSSVISGVHGDTQLDLTIKSQDSTNDWLNFRPDPSSADKVTSLGLAGYFSTSEIRHFCTIFRHIDCGMVTFLDSSHTGVRVTFPRRKNESSVSVSKKS